MQMATSAALRAPMPIRMSRNRTRIYFSSQMPNGWLNMKLHTRNRPKYIYDAVSIRICFRNEHIEKTLDAETCTAGACTARQTHTHTTHMAEDHICIGQIGARSEAECTIECVCVQQLSKPLGRCCCSIEYFRVHLLFK